MKKILLIFAVIFVSCNAIDEQKDKEEITIALNKSAEDWSSGNIEAYMDVYWKSDKLQFIGKNGVTYGWQQTLNNYKKGYPTKEHTGKLTFNILNINFLAKDLYSLTGEYHLERNVGNADGIYTLIFKKIGGKWVIISDHSE
jgi:ketosteroid isomerase-like protein